jgi:hypothetical protein
LVVILAFHALCKEWRAVTLTAIALASSLALIAHEVVVAIVPTLLEPDVTVTTIASNENAAHAAGAAANARSGEPPTSAADNYGRYADAGEGYDGARVAGPPDEARGLPMDRDAVRIHEYPSARDPAARGRGSPGRATLPVAVPVDLNDVGIETPIEGEVILEGLPVSEPRRASVASELAIAVPTSAAHDSPRASAGDKDLCKICLDLEADTLLLPCKHLCACADCAAVLTSCPICRAAIAERMRVYK